ncbi:MAG: CZB domain-containing protein [Giesbergeria sp.]
MGFFSRMFKIREQDSASPETTWAYEDNASELILDPEYAATLMTEFDIDAAITSHEEWKLRLEKLLAGQSEENLDPEQVRQHEHCPLGQWLQGEGRDRLGHYPAFEMLVQRHAYFHGQAASVVALSQAGEHEKAHQVFKGGYRHASNQVTLLLKELKRSLGR